MPAQTATELAALQDEPLRVAGAWLLLKEGCSGALSLTLALPFPTKSVLPSTQPCSSATGSSASAPLDPLLLSWISYVAPVFNICLMF